MCPCMMNDSVHLEVKSYKYQVTRPRGMDYGLLLHSTRQVLRHVAFLRVFHEKCNNNTLINLNKRTCIIRYM